MRQRPGFTMIELLIVLVVMAILASIAATRMRDTTERAHVSVLESDLRSLAMAQEIYYHKVMHYGELAEMSKTFKPSEGVTIDLTWVAADGFAATATHAAVPGVLCGVFQGPADPGDTGPAVAAGQVACE
jgi:prepilin-type N-terminal cleavage/methylation domain-containing protein